MDGYLAPSLTEFKDRFRDVGSGLQPANHFDQLHERDWVEEVHADQSPGIFESIGDRGHADRRRIRCQHRLRFHQCFELLKECALGLKGLGELGIIGVNAAIANAVHHATGRRIRSLPIRLEDVA
jgi:hypothetical protein